MQYLSVLPPLFISPPLPPLATPEGSSVKSGADNAHMGSDSCLVCESIARQELHCKYMSVQTSEHFNPSTCAFASFVKLLQLMTHLKMVERGLHDTFFKLSDPVFPFLLSLSSHIAGLLIMKEVKGMQDSTLEFFVTGLQEEDDGNLCDSMLVCNQMRTEVNFYLLKL